MQQHQQTFSAIRNAQHYSLPTPACMLIYEPPQSNPASGMCNYSTAPYGSSHILTFGMEGW
ncbi:hypothetical protein M407DRAFT_243512 [Tulasnella calospora MUT 4182]|uniref:Uncharacterized protein n=1 Tax=Tulasnella calospora MUT 4182 TaxID=1051891 RepID=A0A0C3QKS3_9AGAM|nr:hypothetical protein M407DRAFT_243512 [Tulasnella calospora MUT 4182]